MKKFLILIIFFFFSMINVNAASICSLTEQANIRKQADNVKITSEIVEDTIIDDNEEWPIELFQITILNLPEELYVKITNNVNEEEKFLSNEDSVDGVISFKWDYMVESTRFKVEIYTSDKTGCPHEVYKSSYIDMPRYNGYSEMNICRENSDLSLCQKYVTWEKLTEEEFLNKLNKELEAKEKSENKESTIEKTEYKNPAITFINNYRWIFISTGKIIILAITSFVIIKKIKRRRKIINNRKDVL